MDGFNEILMRAWSDRYWDAITLLAVRRDHTGTYFGAPIAMVKDEQDGLEKPPTFKLTKHQAQVLMDDLWNCGLRPSEGTGSAGQLAATQAHLADARRIAFGLLNGVPSYGDPEKPKQHGGICKAKGPYGQCWMAEGHDGEHWAGAVNYWK